MEKHDAVRYMHVLAKARAKAAEAISAFTRDTDDVLVRLVYEGVANYMSPEQIAAETGVTNKRVRTIMRRGNLNPAHGKRMLATNAAEALQSNADLMGIKPWQMNLLSPLAYLPMGNRLKEELTEAGVHQAEFLETRCPSCSEFFSVDSDGMAVEA